MNRFDCRDFAIDDLANAFQIREAYECLSRHGYVILDHVVSGDVIDSLRTELNDRYSRYMRDEQADDTVRIGDRRYMLPLSFSGGFGDPVIFANPYVIAVIRQALEEDAIIEAFGAIVSLSGAEAQHLHRDSPLLFNSAISALLPAYAVRLALPLVEMNELHGTTAVWPGSHRLIGTSFERPPEYPVVPIGSCLLWDFRLRHRGTGNRSSEHRPIIHATYARRWYQDPVNFEKTALKRIAAHPEFLESIPDDVRRLLSHVG